jgi:Holliday junction resolvasome RuvABC ATP-dependent DNA helicase subunit
MADNNIENNFLNNIYEDFFGGSHKKYEDLKRKVSISKDIPEIKICNKEIVSKEQQNVQHSEVLDEQATLKMLLEKIDKLYITDESKETLNKIVKYMDKYYKKETKQYIPFNLIIYCNNKETLYSIADILKVSSETFGYIKKGESIEASLYALEKVDQIEDIYDAKNSIIIINDIEGLIAKEQLFKDRFISNLENKIEENFTKTITILTDESKDVIKELLSKNNNLKENIFSYEIEGVKPDVQDIYQDVLEKVKNNGETDENFKIKLLEYISITYPNSNLNFNQYKERLIGEILLNKQEKLTEELIPKYEKEKTIDEVFASLDELVGLQKVKQMLRDLVSLIELKKKTKDDLKIKDTNLHMVFLGNPGTGKTTVARIVAQILYNLKYTKQNKLIEVSSKDLVAEYVGQTAPKTMAIIEKALGGVLFIDEAYSLASGNGEGNSYNEEAIATLIQAMENYRDNLVVIFAGYTKEMQGFLNANSGIVSRIGYTVEFEDYTVDELIQIFDSMMKKSGFIIEKSAIEKAKDIINEYKDTKNFGNARFVRNLYEKTVIKHASNTKGQKKKCILKTIIKDDISTENLLKM